MSEQIYDEKEHKKAINSCLDRANDLAQSRVGRPTMNDLKPVAWMLSMRETDSVMMKEPDRNRAAEIGVTVTDLYAIPSTHRVVGVGLLESAFESASMSGMIDAGALMNQLRAIIDNKTDS